MNAMEYIPFSFNDAVRQGWKVFKRAYPLLLVATVVSIGIGIGLSMIGNMIQVGFTFMARGTNSVQIAGVIASAMWQLLTTIFISGPLQCSSLYACAAAWRGESIGKESLFRGFYRYWRSVGVYWLMIALGIALLVPASVVIIPAIVATATTNGAWWSILLLVLVALMVAAAFLYFYVRVGYAYLICVDPQAGDLGAWESIRTCWRWTAPHAWSLMLLALLMTALVVISAACLFLPFIFFGMPLAMAVSGAAYQQVGVHAGVFPMRFTCPACLYDLRGIGSPTCPECGTLIPDEVRRPLTP